MLSPEQEIHSAYLRTLRQTLTDVLAPEVPSPAVRNAMTLCDFILIRMIAACDELPGIRATHGAAYRHCLESTAALLGEEPARDGAPIWTAASQLQRRVRELFEQLDQEPPAQRKQTLELLAEIAGSDAHFREDYENGAKRVASRHEAPLRSRLITSEAVQAYLDKRFPGQRLHVRECRQIAAGRSKLTAFIALAPNAQMPADLVMRLDNPGSAQDTSVRDEFPVLKAVHRAGTCAPEPLWLESDSSHFGAPFLVMRRMAGSTPGDVWSAEGVPRDLALALAEALVHLQRVDAASIWSAAPVSSRNAIEQMIAQFEKKRHAENVLSSVTLAFARSWLTEHVACLDGPAVPVHGDVHFGNVLAEDDRLICLTDWEFAHPGHPAEDLAFCRRYVEQIMSWDDFMAHYLASGGMPVTEDQLRFFSVFGLLRNATLATDMLETFLKGSIHDVQNLSIALNSRARIEALLSGILASEMAGSMPPSTA